MEGQGRLAHLLSHLDDEKKYIFFLCSLLLVFTTVYGLIHYPPAKQKGYEKIQLKPEEIGYIVARLDVPVQTIVKSGGTSKTINRYSVIDGNIVNIRNFLTKRYSNCETNDLGRLMIYYRSLLPKAEYKEVENEPLKVSSYFWLSGIGAYIEIIFWTIFGVLAFLIYSISCVIADKKVTFDPNHIPSQLSKLFYAPVITLIIIFAYQYATSGEGIELETSKGILIVSFLLGFYSGRAIELLNRVKDVILPYSATTLQGDPEPPKQNNGTTEAGAVKVKLNIDETGLPPESDYELIKNQLAKATVLLQDTVTQSSIQLFDTSEDQEYVFEAVSVPAKKYVVKAELATAEGLHFSCEEEVDTHEKMEIELTLKISELAG